MIRNVKSPDENTGVAQGPEEKDGPWDVSEQSNRQRCRPTRTRKNVHEESVYRGKGETFKGVHVSEKVGPTGERSRSRLTSKRVG